MSNVIIPDAGKKPRAAKILAGSNYNIVRLFKNNAVISHNTVLADLNEADFSGYAAIQLQNGTVQVALDASGRALTLFDMVTWQKNGATGNTIYGYYYTDGAGNLTAVEKWDLPVDMSVNLQVLQFVPQDTEGSQFLNT